MKANLKAWASFISRHTPAAETAVLVLLQLLVVLVLHRNSDNKQSSFPAQALVTLSASAVSDRKLAVVVMDENSAAAAESLEIETALFRHGILFHVGYTVGTKRLSAAETGSDPSLVRAWKRPSAMGLVSEGTLEEEISKTSRDSTLSVSVECSAAVGNSSQIDFHVASAASKKCSGEELAELLRLQERSKSKVDPQEQDALTQQVKWQPTMFERELRRQWMVEKKKKSRSYVNSGELMSANVATASSMTASYTPSSADFSPCTTATTSTGSTSTTSISSGSDISTTEEISDPLEVENREIECVADRDEYEVWKKNKLQAGASQSSRDNYATSTRGDADAQTNSDNNGASNNENGKRKLLSLPSFSLGLLTKGLGAGPSMATINTTLFRWQSITPASSVDWRLTPYMTPVTPQYSCQSCWAMAAVDAVAIMWAIIKKSPPLSLSPQEICDCAAKQCCRGGWPEWAFAYILFNGGISSADDYPYSAVDRLTCLLNETTTGKVAMITGWEQVPPRSSLALMQAVTMQPVVIFINADSPDFQMYSSRGFVRVYNGLCSKDITHAVLLVGYNVDNSALGPYWIIKNSWAKSWGDRGFMYIAMSDGDGTCGMNSIPGIYPVYYPVGPQQVPISSGMVQYNNYITQATTSTAPIQGQWWNVWQWGLPAYPDACAGIINPCGGGTCTSSSGIARCNCNFFPFKYTEVRGVPTSKCVLSNPCEASPYTNPCGAGSCSSPNDGSYSCTCPSGYVIGSGMDGTVTCIVGNISPATRTYRTNYGETCNSIENSYGISDATFKANNPFVDCSTVLPPGMILSVGISVGSGCARSYTVRLYDSCLSISFLVLGGISALQALNPQLRCPYPYPGQQICLKSNAITSSTPDPTVLCGQTYTTKASDTCAKIQSTFGISSSTFAKLNPGLICTVTELLFIKTNVVFTAGIQVCVKSKINVPSALCSKYYTISHGDNCATIWNAANLSSTDFLSINQGVKCVLLEIGSTVCIDSPVLGTNNPEVTPIPYVVQNGDSLDAISNIFASRCYASSITPYKIATFNRLGLYSPLQLYSTILIPCNKRVGYIDCGCAPSIPVCGADYITYPSYCDAMCNYALPSTTGMCGICQSNCNARTGITPKASSVTTCSAICPYPTWQPNPNDVSLVVGSDPGKVCTYVSTTCDNVCQATKTTLGGTGAAQRANYNACYSQCLCCNRIPCAGPACPAPLATCQAQPERCVCSGSTCQWKCSWWNGYFGVTPNTVP